jgi:hypothetical protein
MTELINNDAAVNAIASPPEPASGAGLDPGSNRDSALSG